MNVEQVLINSSKHWDGAVISGIIGHGDAFVLRDPSGIRPAYYYADDEIVVATWSDLLFKPLLMYLSDDIKEVTPGHALIVKKDGSFKEVQIMPSLDRKSCP